MSRSESTSATPATHIPVLRKSTKVAEDGARQGWAAGQSSARRTQSRAAASVAPRERTRST